MKYEKPTIVINKIEVKENIAELTLTTVSDITAFTGWSNLAKATNVNYY